MEESIALPKGYVVEVRVYRAPAPPHDLGVDVTLSPTWPSLDQTVTIRFEVVTDLRLPDLNSTAYLILVATDIRSWQRERCAFEIRDVEDEFSLKCLNFHTPPCDKPLSPT